MQTNSPIRYKAMQALPASARAPFEEFAAHLVVNLRRTREKEPDLYKIVIERTRLEDDIFGLTADLHKAPADQQAELKTKLREKLVARSAANLTERKLRLARLAATLAEEQNRLATDSKPENLDGEIDKQLSALVNSKENKLMPSPGGPHPHDHGDDGGPPPGMK